MSVIYFCNNRRMFYVLVLCCVISVCHGQDEEEQLAAQLFEPQRVAPNSEQNEVMVQNPKMAKQYFEISPGNPFLQGQVPISITEEEAPKQENVMHYEINPENPFLQQFLGNSQQGIVNRGQPEVTTARPRRTSTQRVTTSTTRRPVSRITTTTPAGTTYRQIPGLMLYLSPTIEETRRKQTAHTLHTSRPVTVTIRTTSSPIIGSFLPKTNPNIVNIFQRFGVPGVEPRPSVESTVEEPLLSDEEMEDIFGNYEAMRLAPKLFVS
ncbi:hypothetical protein CBL_12858 [Carabus blaptoides fortunei]